MIFISFKSLRGADRYKGGLSARARVCVCLSMSGIPSVCASYWIYVSNCVRAYMRHVCDSFLSISLEVSLASTWIGNDRVDPWKANTRNIGYISLRCAFMLFEHEVANTERFFKTRASAHTGGELLSTSLSVARPVEFFVKSSSFFFFFRMIARTSGKFPPRSVASGWGVPKTASQTRWFSTRCCCFATLNPSTRHCSSAAWSSCFCG